MPCLPHHAGPAHRRPASLMKGVPMSRTENRAAPASAPRLPFGKRPEGRERRDQRRAARSAKESFLRSGRA
ncbi:hypothetical protein Mpop_2695 [Methylorubrum populi BJ001]|uniref:Uncharacterized protein n=1 Tax=Methylorubrum populi (strain ATCC BAA-705 / NCIMB 13946 / BJ001) TaxID=441620 RepID=B1ZCY1_METPB|nr:hypothetical protein Mpop_2695 [Methylorubrum populi BJ001]